MGRSCQEGDRSLFSENGYGRVYSRRSSLYCVDDVRPISIARLSAQSRRLRGRAGGTGSVGRAAAFYRLVPEDRHPQIRGRRRFSVRTAVFHWLDSRAFYGRGSLFRDRYDLVSRAGARDSFFGLVGQRDRTS